ncbi:MAG: biopolymer transport protein ExbB [Parvicellaceae bacterium]|jgi:biopolymer transport protein ExbB
MISNIFYFIQTTPITLPGMDTTKQVESQSLWDLVWGYTPGEDGEPGYYSWTSIIVVSLLLFMSVMAIYIFIERYLNIRKALKEEKTFMVQIKSYMTDGNLDGARNLCVSTDNPMARMIEKGVMRIGKPVSDIKASIENVAELEVHKLENRISTLGTIAGAAPMLGFLGTVIGMMRTFNDMKIHGVDLKSISGGMMEAMVTTVAGLIVGIIAYASYNFLVSKMGQVIHKMESASISFVDILEEPGK